MKQASKRLLAILLCLAVLPVEGFAAMAKNKVTEPPAYMRELSRLVAATAQALASFCRKTGTPNRSRKKAQTGTSSQPGRLGGLRISPLRLSSGPPQLTPIPTGTARREAHISPTASASAGSMSRQCG